MERLKKLLLYLVSFAVGGLFGDALIHLIPESFEQLGSGPRTSLFIVLGILLFFILEKIFITKMKYYEILGDGYGK